MYKLGKRLGRNGSGFVRPFASLVMALLTYSFAAPLAAQTLADAQIQSTGVPSWVWIVGALIVLAIIVFAFMRRKRESVITTSSTGRTSGPDIKTRG